MTAGSAPDSGGRIARRRLGVMLVSVVLGLGGCRSLRVELVAAPARPPTPAATATTTTVRATATAIAEPAPDTPTPTEVAATATAAPNQPETSFPPPPVSQMVSGAISASGQKDRYRLEARQGQLFEARVKRTSGVSLVPALELVDPTGASEATAFGLSEQSVLVRRLASTGTYTLVVSGSGQGPYSVAWSLDRYGQLVSGGQVSAEFIEKDELDRYLFVGRQDQMLDARVKRTSGISLTPSLTLVDPMGLQEASHSLGFQGESTLQRKLASSGTYVLVVGGPGLGPYTVQLTLQ